MIIRTFQEQDRPQLIELFNEFGDFFVGIDEHKFIIRAENYATTFLDEMLQNTLTNGIIYIAEDQNKIVGFIGGNIKDLTAQNTVENISMRKGRILEFFVTK